MPRLEIYTKIKENFEFENFKKRYTLTRFRCSAHNLHIEVGRHHNIPRSNRLCTCCSLNHIENEYHFILICPMYREQRLKFLPKFAYSWPNIQKIVKIFKSQKKKHCINLSLFIYSALEIRGRMFE